jgi:hypothetical protein
VGLTEIDLDPGPLADQAEHNRLARSVRDIERPDGLGNRRRIERYAHVNDAELARAVRITSEHVDAAKVAPTKTPTAAQNSTERNVSK